MQQGVEISQTELTWPRLLRQFVDRRPIFLVEVPIGASRRSGDDLEDSAVARAVAHLVEQQNPDGSWNENEFTGTGFPCVFYLKYHLYRNSFPVYALSRYQNQARRADEFCALKFQPNEFRLRSGI